MFAWCIGLVLMAGAQDTRPLPRLTWGPYAFLEKGLRTAPWVKDPFFPESNGFKLSGIISNELAFINGKWLRHGDLIDGYTVRQIAPSQVTLMRKSEIVVLKMEN